MAETYSAVFERQAPVFDCAGTFLYHPLRETQRFEIKPVMVKRLVDYAAKRLAQSGYLMQGNTSRIQLVIDPTDSLSDGVFQVGFINDKGGEIGVKGIFIKHAWPVIDHGFYIESH